MVKFKNRVINWQIRCNTQWQKALPWGTMITGIFVFHYNTIIPLKKVSDSFELDTFLETVLIQLFHSPFFHAEIPAASRPLHGRTWDTVFRGKPRGSAKAGPRFPWKSGERLPLMISGGFWREFSGLIFRCTGEAQPPMEIAIFWIPPLKILRAGGNRKTFPGPAVFLCLYSPEATDTVPKKKELRIEVSRLRRLTSIFNSQFFLVRRHLIPDEVSRSGKH